MGEMVAKSNNAWWQLIIMNSCITTTSAENTSE